ncbi:hypothetical protein Tco_0142939, partial [Tanacetum coccineum]
MTDSSFSSTADNEDLSDIDNLAEERLMTDYFGANGDQPKYPDYYFRRRYRMSRKLFLKIVK